MTAISDNRDDMRELDFRASDGIEVRLLWQTGSQDVIVEVVDVNAGDSFRFDVTGSRALDAFTHPYAYVAGDAIGFADPEPSSACV